MLVRSPPHIIVSGGNTILYRQKLIRWCSLHCKKSWKALCCSELPKDRICPAALFQMMTPVHGGAPGQHP